MEQNQDPSLFGLTIDANSRIHLAEAARWARFLAVVGFVICAVVVVAGIFAGLWFFMRGNIEDTGFGAGMPYGLGIFTLIIYIFVAVLYSIIYFFPCLFLFRFANQMKTALASNDQHTFNTSFQNLKIMLRYVGILTIIALSFYAIILLMTFVSIGVGGFR